MDFTQNESQRELAALTRTHPHRAGSRRSGWPPPRPAATGSTPALWADLAGAGILAAALPESLGGAGLGLLEQCSVLTELGPRGGAGALPGLDRARRPARWPGSAPRTSSAGGRRPPGAAS